MRDVVLISSEEDKKTAEEISPPPRMTLRVLLVESDDSTRRIISALLRKCSYRVVAVPDGLMAWETLKDQPQNIDLILTELDLPSITGFALLALIMEHESCKNIPVIMMSTQDSVSMVLKCMLKGAADFLIKPVRKNELKNLWQHVWRRHTLHGGNVHQSSPVLQPKLEATSENNSAVNQSEKEPAIARDRMQEKFDEFGAGEGKGRDEEKNRDETTSYRKDSKEFKSSSVTMNLIGAFDNRLESFSRSCCSNESSSPELELSLRRVLSGDLRSQEANKKSKLCHSDASAFSRYDNGKSWQLAFPAAAAANPSEPNTPSKSHETSNELYRDATVNSDIQVATTSTNEENIASSVSEQSAKVELGYQSSEGDITVQPMFLHASGSSPHGSGTNQTQHKQESKNEICQFQGTVNCSNEHDRATAVIGQCTSSETCADGFGCLKEEIVVSHDGLRGMDAQRSSQREAALLKFRLKRKDRCFEKKVRYQSRKKLAEQRPRVKGQFVRAVQTVSQAPDASDF